MLSMQQSYIAFWEIFPNLKQFVGGGRVGGNLPGRPVVKILLPLQGTQVRALVRKDCVPHASGQLSPHTTNTELCSRACIPQQEKPH